MIEQKIKISKNIINVLMQSNQNKIDQISLNCSLLSDICDLLNQKNLNNKLGINDSILIPNNDLQNSFYEKIEIESNKTSLMLDKLSELEDNDNLSLAYSSYSNMTKDFNKLYLESNEDKKQLNNKIEELEYKINNANNNNNDINLDDISVINNKEDMLSVYKDNINNKTLLNEFEGLFDRTTYDKYYNINISKITKRNSSNHALFNENTNCYLSTLSKEYIANFSKKCKTLYNK